MKSYIEKHHKILGVVGGIIALAVAVIYFKVIPQEAATASGIQKIILVYGHSFCWILLSSASILWAIMNKNRWSKILAYAALASYLVFMGTLLVAKFM